MISKKELDAFMACLPAGKKILEQSLWETVKRAFPGQGVVTDWRPKLADILSALAAEGKISLPKGKSYYTGIPSLPVWIIRNDLEKKTRERLEGHIWAQELAFLADQPLEVNNDWLILDRWLKHGGRNADIIPVRERSLEIFNDEKRLDSFLRRKPFVAGLLSLTTFRCYYVASPIAWQPGPEAARSRPGIVIENSNTYATVCEFNRRVGWFAYVAYGGGNAFTATQEGASEVAGRYGHDTVYYFGDIDWDGLEIPSVAARRLAIRGIRLLLHEAFYELLIRARVGKEMIAGGRARPVTLEMEKILSKSVGEEIKRVVATGGRMPQEGVKLSLLLELL
jgi:hypothetical protein